VFFSADPEDPRDPATVGTAAFHDAFMVLFAAELDRVLYRNGVLVGDAERARIGWVVARLMGRNGDLDVEAVERTYLYDFLPRERSLHRLPELVDELLAQHPGADRPDREWAIRAIRQHLDADVGLSIADVEQVYRARVLPEHLLSAHRDEVRLWFVDHHGLPPTTTEWERFAGWLTAVSERLAADHGDPLRESTRHVQALSIPATATAGLIEWARHPGHELYDAESLRRVLDAKADGTEGELVEAFAAVERFWRVLLLRQAESGQRFFVELLGKARPSA